MSGIIVKNLKKSFGNVHAVRDISFQVEQGRVMGFLGPNGAGKTTALRMLVGLSKPDAGSIEIGGEKVVFGNTRANIKFGYLPELPAFYGWMTGYEYLNFIADTFYIKGEEKIKKISQVLKTVDLESAKNRRIGGYSGGMKQRLGIAQALINDPEVLIMDEPVSALDPIGRKEVLGVLGSLKTHKTILFSTHILTDVDKICDDVLIINKGKIITVSPLAELKEKYAKPILEVEFSQDPSGFIQSLQRESWVESIETRGNGLKIWLRDSNIVNKNIPLEKLLGLGIGILKYGLILPEVEDLFVSLVREEK